MSAAHYEAFLPLRISLGTAIALGLSEAYSDAPVTTAYLMLGEGCSMDCGFCAQAKSSRASAGRLSRVVWPEADPDEVLARLASSSSLQRICLQVVCTRDFWQPVFEGVDKLRQSTPKPISVSAKWTTLTQAKELLEAGVDRLCLALDAATPGIGMQVKMGNWQKNLQLLEDAASRFPGRLCTHLIVGLGESEEQMIRLMQRLIVQGIGVGLFAFTPVWGTKLSGHQPPPLDSYRRVQIALYLLQKDPSALDRLIFSDGRLKRIDTFELTKGEPNQVSNWDMAFRTSGCSGCNRPYYNERPGGVMYNYPRPMTPNEVIKCLREAQIGLELNGKWSQNDKAISG